MFSCPLFKVYKKVFEFSFTPTKNILVFSFWCQFIQRISRSLFVTKSLFILCCFDPLESIRWTECLFFRWRIKLQIFFAYLSSSFNLSFLTSSNFFFSASCFLFSFSISSLIFAIFSRWNKKKYEFLLFIFLCVHCVFLTTGCLSAKWQI